MFACSWIRVKGWNETAWLSDCLPSRQNPQIISMHTSAWVKQTLLNHLLLISAPHSSEDDHDPGQSSALRCCGSSYPWGIWAGREKPFLVIALYLRGRPDIWPWSDYHPLRADLHWIPTPATLAPALLPSEAEDPRSGIRKSTPLKRTESAEILPLRLLQFGTWHCSWQAVMALGMGKPCLQLGSKPSRSASSVATCYQGDSCQKTLREDWRAHTKSSFLTAASAHS